jgi:hypothetical protein
MVKFKNKELKAMEQAWAKMEFEWAQAKGVDYPLNPRDRQRYEFERYLESRFWQVKDLFISGWKSKDAKKAVSAEGVTLELWPLLYDDIVNDRRHNTMSDADMDKAIAAIVDAVMCPLGISFSGYTAISLSSKFQYYAESGSGCNIGKMLIMVSSSKNISKPVFLGDNEKMLATIYAGWFPEAKNEDDFDFEDEDDTPECTEFGGFLAFLGKDMQKHIIQLEEFCMLAEISDSDFESPCNYIFTFFSEERKELLIQTIPTLEGVRLSLNNYELEFTTADDARQTSDTAADAVVSNDTESDKLTITKLVAPSTDKEGTEFKTDK